MCHVTPYLFGDQVTHETFKVTMEVPSVMSHFICQVNGHTWKARSCASILAYCVQFGSRQVHESKVNHALHLCNSWSKLEYKLAKIFLCQTIPYDMFGSRDMIWLVLRIIQTKIREIFATSSKGWPIKGTFSIGYQWKVAKGKVIKYKKVSN